MIDVLKVLKDQGIRTSSYIFAASDALIKSFNSAEYSNAIVALVGVEHGGITLGNDLEAKYFYAYVVQGLVKAHLAGTLETTDMNELVLSALASAHKKV